LALVAGQDVEPAEDSDRTDRRWRIARRVAPDRVISTVDPETCHTRKSKSVRRGGFRGHLSPQHLLHRLFPSGTHLPIVHYTVSLQVDSQYNTVEVIAEYDIYGDPPDRFNPLVFANGVLGRDHSLAAFSDPASVPPQNVLVTTNSRGATTTTYLVPASELPLVSQLRKWGGAGSGRG
jgi:hypothetical protein